MNQAPHFAAACPRDRRVRALLLIAFALLPLLAGSARATVIYEQPHNGTGTIYRSCWSDPDGTVYDEVLWDGFQLASSQAITEIHWRGGHDPAYAPWGQPVIDFRVEIFPSIGAGTQPDVVAGPLCEYQSPGNCGETPAGTFGGVAMYDYHYTLPSPFQAAAGVRYWVHIYANQGGIPDWGFAAATGGNGSHFRKTEYMYQMISGDAAFSLHGSAAPTATITTSVEPAGTGSVFGAGVYPIGSNCTLTATAAAGYGFSNWTVNGGVVSSNPQYTFTVTANRTVVAHFVPACVVTLDRWPIMGGHVDGAGTFNQGTPVTVTAVSGLGYAFTGWLEWGATLVSTSPSYTFTATSDVLLVAQFEQLPLAATFDFDTGDPPCWVGQTMPATQTHSGLTAALTARTGFWSIQDDIYWWTPLDFAGNFLYPSSSGSSLRIVFSQPVTELRLDFATAELSADYDIASLVRIRGYQGSEAGPLVASASDRGAWLSGAYPEGQVGLSSATPFDVAVIDIPPQQGYPVSGLLFVDNIVAVHVPGPPDPVQDLVIQADNGDILLSWTPTGAASYNVYRDAAANGTYATLLGSTTGSTFMDPGAANAATMGFYRVRAVNP